MMMRVYEANAEKLPPFAIFLPLRDRRSVRRGGANRSSQLGNF